MVNMKIFITMIMNDEYNHLEFSEAARLKQAVFQLPVIKVISEMIMTMIIARMVTCLLIMNMVMIMPMMIMMMLSYRNERMHISSFM